MEIKSNNLWHTAIGLVAILILAVLSYFLFKKTILFFSLINPELAVGIIAACATVFVSVATVVISKKQEQKTLVESNIRQKKIPIYEKIIEFIFRLTFQDKTGAKPMS